MKTTNLAVLLSSTALIVFFTSGCHQPTVETPVGTNSVSTQGAPTVATWQNSGASNSNEWSTVISATTDALKSAKKPGNTDSNILANTAITPDGATSTNYFAYDYSRKNDFVVAAKTSLDDLDQNAADFLHLISITPNGANGSLQEKLQQINNRRADLGEKYNDVKAASQTNWNNVRAAFVKSYYNLKTILKAGEDSVTAKM